MRQSRATGSAVFRFAPMLLLALLLAPVVALPATAQVNIAIGAPSIDIGIHFPALPSLTVVPGTPVYYAPSVDTNFFFYDGMYWVLKDDTWYTSSWYNGPWAVVDPDIVPDFILRVPVRYYRHPPSYFHGWAANAPPRWGEHWGKSWEGKHAGWEQAAHAPIPRAAPVPTYQRQYTGSATRCLSSKRCCTASTTSTNLTRQWCSNTISSMRRRSSTATHRERRDIASAAI